MIMRRSESSASSQLDNDFIATIRLHMQQEEATLTETLATLHETRKSLLDNNLKAFTDSVRHQAKAADTAAELRATRTQMMQVLSVSLDIPHAELTLKRIGQELPESAAQWIGQCRQRLRAMAEEAQRVNYQNALMIRQSVDLTRNVLSQLTKDEDSGDTYNSAGAKQDPLGDPLIELGG